MTNYPTNTITSRSSFTECLKTKAFKFDYLEDKKQTEKRTRNTNSEPKPGYHWQPKIKEKKMKKDPKFSISVLNKKSRVQFANNSYQLINTQQNYLFLSPAKKIFHKFSHSNINQSFDQKYYEVQISYNFPSAQKQLKTPHMNFNMNLLIEKRKNLKNLKNQKRKRQYWKKQTNNNQCKQSINTNLLNKQIQQPKGNSMPFYMHFLAKNYDKKRVQSAINRNHSVKAMIIRQLHTVPNERSNRSVL